MRKLTVSVDYGNMPLEYQYLGQYHGFPNPIAGTPLGKVFGLPVKSTKNHYAVKTPNKGYKNTGYSYGNNYVNNYGNNRYGGQGGHGGHGGHGGQGGHGGHGGQGGVRNPQFRQSQQGQQQSFPNQQQEQQTQQQGQQQSFPNQ